MNKFFHKALYYIHMLIIILVILIPIYPIEIIKYTFFIPIILPIIWLIFGDCPLSKYHYKGIGPFDIIRFILKKLKLKESTIENRVIYVYYLTLMLIFALSILRLINHYCMNSIQLYKKFIDNIFKIF